MVANNKQTKGTQKLSLPLIYGFYSYGQWMQQWVRRECIALGLHWHSLPLDLLATNAVPLEIEWSEFDSMVAYITLNEKAINWYSFISKI